MNRTGTLDVVAVVEAAWQVDLPLPKWMEGVLEAAKGGLDDGHGVWAALYDASDRTQVRFLETVGVGMGPERLEMLRLSLPGVPWDAVERTFLTRTCGTISQLLGDSFLEEQPLAQYVAQTHGIHDSLGINAQDVTGCGCVIGVPLSKRTRASKALSARWSRIAAHVAASFRLRRQLDQSTSGEAMLGPDGLVAHAEGEAKDVAARAALRAAAVAVERARTRQKRADPDGALEQWRAMVDGRWSLVDHFERDGKRFYVARRNEPGLGGDPLTLRERQVAGFAALGHSNKLIAYELGLSASTIATHLSQAARKLKCRTRVELIQKLSRG